MKRLIALFVVLLSGVFVSQAAAVTTKDVVPFQTELVTCSGETITLSGELMLLSHLNSDANGGFHDHLSVDWRNVKGLSASGVKYHAVSGLHENLNLNSSGTLSETFVDQMLLVSQGGDENLLVQSRFHMTITPEGDMRAFVSRFTERCVG
jgi:hypothetical protein